MSDRGQAFDQPISPPILCKRLIWLYFWLLLLEGALRKWVLPQYSNPLLVIRDPVLLWIYFEAFKLGLFPKNRWITITAALAVSGAMISMLTLGNVAVILYGVHSNFLHLPLIFVIPRIFNAQDVKIMGKWLLITALPMALLVAMQFNADPSARVNVGAGGEGGQLGVSMGKIRPPGTFSFTNGLAMYLSLLAAFLLYAPIERRLYHRVILLLATPSLMVMVAVSGSRGALASVMLITGALVLVCVRKPIFFGRSFMFTILAAVSFVVVSFWGTFQQGMSVHTVRFDEGGGLRFGIIERFFGEYVDAFSVAANAPVFGHGLGLGTNAGAGLMRGERSFLLAEGEWARILLESGAFFGFAYIFLRLGIIFYLLRKSFSALDRENPLPMLIFSACMLPILNGQFGQPTALGFAVLGGGLCLAARRDYIPLQAKPSSARQEIAKLPGRSAYAQRLHGETKKS